MKLDFTKLHDSITRYKEYRKCNSVSVARTMLKGAFLGLDFLVKNVMRYHTMIIKLENAIWNFKLIIKVKEN